MTHETKDTIGLVATLLSNGGVVAILFFWRVIRNAHSHKKPARGQALTYEGIEYVIKRQAD